MEVFDADGFMVALGGAVKGDVEEEADFFEKAFESAAIINNNDATKTDFE